MFHVLADGLIAVSVLLGGLLLGGRDPRHGREVTVMLAVCVVCAVVGVAGAMA